LGPGGKSGLFEDDSKEDMKKKRRNYPKSLYVKGGLSAGPAMDSFCTLSTGVELGGETIKQRKGCLCRKEYEES